MNIIVAVEKNRGIGKDGGLLFRIPEDMRHFKQMTVGKAVVMGRRTFESLPGGKPLKDRVNIVLSADKAFAAEGVAVCRSLAELKEELKKYDTDDVFVIGGQRVFEELMEYCRYAYVTQYDREFEADKRFPDIRSLKNWRLAETIDNGSFDGIAYCIEKYENTTSREI